MSLDADSSEDEGVPMSNLNADSSDDDVETPNVNKPSRIIDSSDDEEPKSSLLKTKPCAGGLLDSSDDEADKVDAAATTKNKGSVDSSDDSGPDDMHNIGDKGEQEETLTTSSKKKKIANKPVDSDSDDEGGSNYKSMFKNKDLFDAESSDEETVTRQKSNSDPEKNDGSDNSSSDEGSRPSSRHTDNSGVEDNEEDISAIKNKVLTKHSNKQERRSKSTAMTEIRSESQRMLRETSVSLPYHKAKQRTLTEFLNRKKGLPEVVKSMKLGQVTPEADRLLQEREKKMEEFYKSDEDEASDEEDPEYKVGDADESTEVGEGTENNLQAVNMESIENDINKTDAVLENATEPLDECKSLKDTENGVNIVQDTVIIENVDGADQGIPKVAEEGMDESETLADNTASFISVPPSLPEVHNENEIEPEKEKNSVVESNNTVCESESLNLILDETPEIYKPPKEVNSVAERKKHKLELLKKQIDSSLLEKTLNVTPKLYSGDTENDELFSPKVEISRGAQKLLNRYVTHAQAKNPKPEVRQTENNDLSVIVKKTNAEGVEVLEKEIVKYKPVKSKKRKEKTESYLSMKESLKKKMLLKKKEDIIKREAILKMNNEEYDELPEDQVIDEDMLEDDEEAQIENEEYEEDDSDLEENDVDMTEKKGRRGLFLDEEADESGEEGGDEEDSDTESLNLVQEDDDEDAPLTKSGRKAGFRKIKNPDLLSEDDDSQSKPSELQETPNLDTCSVRSLAGSTHSSASSAIFNTAPRWTPFKDRIDSQGVEYTATSVQGPADSPTASQMARKRLGFEELFDSTDQDNVDIDDAVGLCSGSFATQPSQQPSQLTQQPGDFSTPATAPRESQGVSIESQDTVILTGNCSVGRDDTAAPSLDALLGLHQEVGEEAGPEVDICPSDEEAPGFLEEDTGARRIVDSDDETDQIFFKKRKRMISDDEESEKNSQVDDMEDIEDLDEGDTVEQDKLEARKSLFDKKGVLRKDFFENEAELSGSDDEEEDEDERGLDRLEMEEGDLEDIDEDEEMKKVGRIHQKVLLDEDQADIRLFQERFLEDGDLHTDNRRTRQFKWKGLDDEIELQKQDSDSGDEDDVVDGEEKWRVQRIERDKWVKDNREAGVDGEGEGPLFLLPGNAPLKTTSLEITSRLETESTSIIVETRAGPLQPIATNRFQRSSFLSRGESTLEKMAVLTKKADDRTGTGAKKGRNFVFAALSPKKAAEGVETAGGGDAPTKPEPVKQKKKPVPAAKKVKLDRTLQTDNRSTIFNHM